MSLYLNFEPHSWYKGWAIRKEVEPGVENASGTGFVNVNQWSAYTDNGDTYRVDELEAGTLRELKQAIKEYHVKQTAKMAGRYNYGK